MLPTVPCIVVDVSRKFHENPLIYFFFLMVPTGMQTNEQTGKHTNGDHYITMAVGRSTVKDLA